jgi:hypothetical protein
VIGDAALNGVKGSLDLSLCSNLQIMESAWQLCSLRKLRLPPHFFGRALPSDSYMGRTNCVTIGKWKATAESVRGFGEPPHGALATLPPGSMDPFQPPPRRCTPLMAEAASYEGVAGLPLGPP